MLFDSSTRALQTWFNQYYSRTKNSLEHKLYMFETPKNLLSLWIANKTIYVDISWDICFYLGLFGTDDENVWKNTIFVFTGTKYKHVKLASLSILDWNATTKSRTALVVAAVRRTCGEYMCEYVSVLLQPHARCPCARTHKSTHTYAIVRVCLCLCAYVLYMFASAAIPYKIQAQARA